MMSETGPDQAPNARRAAVVYPTVAGVGGLGHSAAAGIAAVALGHAKAFALGPGAHSAWPLSDEWPPVTWMESKPFPPAWTIRYSWLRWQTGQAVYLRDRALGRWASRQLKDLRPQSCYLFTQIALEALRWARAEGVQTVLDNPNGHLRNYHEVCEKESQRWFGKSFHGHPSQRMIERVEEEYALSDRVRVYSKWGKESMVSGGVPEEKVHILHQTVNLGRFCPPAGARPTNGPLRICFVGSVDLRKGFVYLLRAMRALGTQQIHLRIVGATGDRDCARLLAQEKQGLQVECAPADSIPVYHQSELLVVPTLEDGLPFVLVEGLACGLPVIVTDQAGAAECVRPGRSGWVIPAGQVEPLAAALESALQRRQDLGEMGRNARADVEQYAGPAGLAELSDWFYSAVPEQQAACSRT